MPVASPVNEKTSQQNHVPAAAANQLSIVDTLPLKVVLMLAAPYLAGKTAEDALEKAHKVFRENRFASTIDILGEDARNDEDCDESVQNFIRLIDLISAKQIPSANPLQHTSVSFKPSMFSSISPASSAPGKQKELECAQQRIEKIVRHAESKAVRVTLEAEDHTWADFHLDTYFGLINAGCKNFGTVVQSRLFRTKKDLKRFDNRTRVRMVIGIYNEPSSVALTDKNEMKRLSVEFSRELLARGTYVELASHDTDCMRSFIEDAVLVSRAPSEQFEVQHLLGVPRKEIQQDFASGRYFVTMAEQASGNKREQLAELARAGVLMRMYLPFGKDHVAGPYCKRRLKANPNMIGFGIKNLFHLK